jgi:hypothetical protein
MPYDQNKIVAANRLQEVSERDSFTPARYRQFYRHFPVQAKQCSTLAATPAGVVPCLKRATPPLS